MQAIKRQIHAQKKSFQTQKFKNLKDYLKKLHPNRKRFNIGKRASRNLEQLMSKLTKQEKLGKQLEMTCRWKNEAHDSMSSIL